MCGIFGVWNRLGVSGQHLLEASRLLKHRGPDDEGFLVFNGDRAKSYSGKDSAVLIEELNPDLPCERALLHRRLSILDLSPKGHQPMSLAGRFHMVFNGEIYNYAELAKTHQIATDSSSDTEVLLGLYAKLGADCFSQLRGMWALAIVDTQKRELILSRDRFGIKPLYISRKLNSLAFSSEIKPLLSLPEMQATWSIDRLYEFLVFGTSSDPFETFFTGIETIPPAETWTFDFDGRLKSRETYYRIGEGTDDHSTSFQSLFEKSMQEHLISDVPVGSCLSGGLDSGLIVATAAARTDYPFASFTCSFPGEAIDETAFAKRLQSVSPDLQQHFTTPSAEDFAEAIDDLIFSLERPFGSASVFAQRVVMNLAHQQGAKVLLDGQGADEAFGGYYPFAGALLLDHLKRGSLSKFASDYKALRRNFNPAMGKAMARAAYYHLPPSWQRGARNHFRKGSQLVPAKYQHRLKSLKSPARSAPGFSEMIVKSVGSGLYELLHYEDRNAMRYGIETRVPFLDHRLVEWAIAQDPGDLMKRGWTKFPLRESLEKLGLPDLAWRRDKIGFAAPQATWIKALRLRLIAQLEQTDWPEQIDKKAFLAMCEGSMDSAADQTAFWRIYALIRWMDIFNIKIE